MRNVSSLDLYNLSICPLRWSQTPPMLLEQTKPQQLLRTALLTRSLEDGEWSLDEICEVWNQIYWEDREFSADGVKATVKALLQAKRGYARATNLSLRIEPAGGITSEVNSINVKSSGDLIVVYPKKVEIWIHTKNKVELIERSVLPVVERFLFLNKTIGMEDHKFFIVLYWMSENSKSPRFSKFEVNCSFSLSDRITRQITRCIKDKSYYPINCKFCETCEAICP